MRRWLSGFAPRRRVFIAAAIAVALLAAVGIVAANANAAGAPILLDTRRDRLGGDRVPVILVPGYGGGRSSLNALAGLIRSTGRYAIVMRLPGDGTGDLNLQARALQTLAAGVLGRANKVDVVGYSAGGVVVRLWIANYGGAREARHVVTLGAPMHGADLATVGQAFVPGACPLACQQLVPGSLLLNTVNARPLPAGVAWMSIWTVDDQTVDPPDSARLDGAINVAAQDLCPAKVITHGDLPTDRLVTRWVLAALGPSPMVTPMRYDDACHWWRLPPNSVRPSS